MTVTALGINHKIAPVDVREQASLLPEKVPHFLQELKNNKWCSGAVVLSTCNRTEFYLDNFIATKEQFFNLWASHAEISQNKIEENHYHYQGAEAVSHLLRVTAGLDSLILGEPQIMGQLRDAFDVSQKENALCKNLHRLFQISFQTAKKIRTETNIGAYTISVAYTTVQLAKQIFDISEQRVLLVGAGETIELVAEHLVEADVKSIAIANRTESRAQEMGSRLKSPTSMHSLTELDELLVNADIVITATSAPHALITKDMAQKALKARKNKPILMVDIAVPRDIATDTNQLDDIYLYSVDDLNKIVEKNYQSREAAAKEAEIFVKENVLEWKKWLQMADFSSQLQSIFEYQKAQKSITLRKASQLSHHIDKPSEEIVEQVVTQMSNRILHPLISVLKELEQEGNSELVNKIITQYKSFTPKNSINKHHNNT